MTSHVFLPKWQHTAGNHCTCFEKTATERCCPHNDRTEIYSTKAPAFVLGFFVFFFLQAEVVWSWRWWWTKTSYRSSLCMHAPLKVCIEVTGFHTYFSSMITTIMWKLMKYSRAPLFVTNTNPLVKSVICQGKKTSVYTQQRWIAAVSQLKGVFLSVMFCFETLIFKSPENSSQQTAKGYRATD